MTLTKGNGGEGGREGGREGGKGQRWDVLLKGVWGSSPRKKLEFRSSEMDSDATV